MTEDITSLQIRILYDSVEKAEARLKALETTGGKATKTVAGFGSKISSSLKSLYAFAAGAAVVTGTIAAMRAIIKTTAEFQQLNAQLVTATGSAQNAAAAFVAIKDFAAQTPYDLQQATGAFIALVNRGLTPSERALRSYGDTASSLGATLSDMVLAVSNATAGEFENLKRFGIRAQKEGDNIAFTFRGVKTTVANNINEIEKYFIELGEKNFGGGMERQMNTLTGAFSNLGDAWDVLKNAIGEEGLGDAVESSIRNITALVSELTAQIESGQIQAGIDGWGIAFEGYVDDVSAGIAYLNEIFLDHGKQGEETGMTLAEGLIGGMKAVVIGYRAYVKTAATILWGLVDSAVQVGKAIYQTIAASFNALIGAAAKAGAAIGNALWAAVSGGDAQAALIDGFAGAAAEITGAADTSRKAWEDAFAKIGINADTVAYNIKDAWNEAGSEIDRAAMLAAEADQKRAQYDKDADARAKIREDRLAKYRVGDGGGTSTPSSKGKKGGGGSREDNEWKTLEEDLRKQETLISESYQRRFDLIEKNTREGSAYQAELEISLTEKFEEEQMKRLDLLRNGSEGALEIYHQEEAILRDSYERRKQIILDATELTEKARRDMLKDAETSYRVSQAEAQNAYWQLTSDTLGKALGDMAEISQAFGKKGFAAYKAFAIAQATIAGIESSIQAYLGGLKWSGGNVFVAASFAAAAAGVTGAQIGMIASQEYSGAYAIGGLIPPGKVGLVGEAGPELVKGPAMVTSAQATWDRAGGAASGGGSNVEVNIINMSGEPVTEKRRQDGDKQLIEFIIGQAREGVANDISKGGTRVAKALESTYNLGRGKRA